MPVKNYRELIAWQKAMDLVEIVYKASGAFPKDELFGLTQQVRRAVVSIPSNIAEGQGRRTTAEFLHFLPIANGSLREVETQLLIAGRLCFLEGQEVERAMTLAAEVGRLVNGLANSPSRKR
jgi:four helix bundle protein